MILSDRDIKTKIASKAICITPYDPKCVQPASVDLHLDSDFKIFRPHRSEIIDPTQSVDHMMEDVRIPKGEAFILHPGTFALGLIAETTGVDAKHVGRLEGKSSLARLGLLIHTTSGFLDPGNTLKMTLELFNASPLPIKLLPGMKIAQMAFEEISSECENPYGSKSLNSKYFGATKIQASQMHRNFTK